MVPWGSSFRAVGQALEWECHAVLMQRIHRIDQLTHRAREAIGLPGHEHIAVVDRGLQRVENSRPSDWVAGDVLGEYVGASGVVRRRVAWEVLIGGGNAGVLINVAVRGGVDCLQT